MSNAMTIERTGAFRFAGGLRALFTPPPDFADRRG